MKKTPNPGNNKFEKISQIWHLSNKKRDKHYNANLKHKKVKVNETH